MSRLDKWLANGLMISDGAWGTQLQLRGLASGTTPDTWNLAHADQVEAVARAYVEAGSQVILTNTFRANAVAMHSSTVAELDDLNRAGVEISKRAAGKRALVFASIGPTGKILMSGEVAPAQVSAAFAAQAQSLAAAGADALLIETMSEIDEARLAVDAALPTGLPVLVSFAFDSGKNKDRTMMGATPETVAAAMAEAGADAVGANCVLALNFPFPSAAGFTRLAACPSGSSPMQACPPFRKALFITPRLPSTSLRISRHSLRQERPSSAVVADQRRSSLLLWLPRVTQRREIESFPKNNRRPGVVPGWRSGLPPFNLSSSLSSSAPAR